MSRMTETQFLLDLSKTTKAYRWSFDGQDGKEIIGVSRSGGQVFDPITAVHRYNRCGTEFKTNVAGDTLGMSTTLVHSVQDAAAGVSNRGNAQVLRGKIRTALGI